jgi:hypothetical protein
MLTIGAVAIRAEPRGQFHTGFDAEPNWEGFRNRLLPKELPVVRQDFGYRTSNFAGGKAAGEIGGTVHRAHARAYYAKAIKPKSLNDQLSASGTFSVTRAGGGSGVLIGWFNDKKSQGWRTPSSLAFRIDGNGGKYWLFYEYGTKEYGTGGGGAFEGERYQTTLTPPFAADGTSHKWSLEYDPAGAERRGLITFRCDDRLYTLPLAEGHKQQGATFDRFGLWNAQTAGDSLDVYLDDLNIDGVEESFDSDPGWSKDGNPVEYEQRVLRPYHDIGYSMSSHAGGRPGEIGGIMFRDEQPMYYADRVGPYSLDDDLKASGRIVLNSASADSAMMLGWFGAEAKRSKSTPEHEVRQTDYVAIMIEGPSRIGHYFRPAYSTAKASGDAPTNEGRPDERPVIRPDGRVHQWSLHYSPRAANRRGLLTLKFDRSTHRLELMEGERSENATLDRFGFFNVQTGGHHVEAYVDDLRYSK